MNIVSSRRPPDPRRDEPPSGRSSPDFHRPDFNNNTDDCDLGQDGAGTGSLHRDLVRFYISHKLSHRGPWSDARSELRATTAALLRKNPGEATPEAAAPAAPLLGATVAEELFADEAPSWGRVVGLMAFGSAVCGCLERRGGEEERGGGGGLNISPNLLLHHRELLSEHRKLLSDNRKLQLDRGPWSGLEALSGEDLWPELMEAPVATGGTPVAPAPRT